MGVFYMLLFNDSGGRGRGRARHVRSLNLSTVTSVDHSYAVSLRGWGQVLDELVDSVVEPIHHHVPKLVEVFLYSRVERQKRRVRHVFRVSR